MKPDHKDKDPIGLDDPERREVLKTLGGAAIVAPLLAFFDPDEAEAKSSIVDSPTNHGGYPAMINRFRRQFGRRMDYQQGFTGATRNTGSITQLPGGAYGILVSNPNSNQIEPASSYPVERAGYIHATQNVNPRERSTRRRWSMARKEVIEQVRTEIQGRYPQYRNERNAFGNPWLLDNACIPVVEMENFSAGRAESFHRVPTPGTREYHLMATKQWADHIDQGKLRHKHAFDVYYDKSLSLFDNLIQIYGPQLQAIANMAQSAKNTVAVTIRAIDRKLGSKLSQSQKDSLNTWLNVRGTQYEI